MSDVMLPKQKINALYLAWIIALVSTLSALFIGEILGKMPCLLCWYQRIAMFPLAIVLGIGCYSSDLSVRKYALPLAFIGTAIAVWHSLVFSGLVPSEVQPCSQNGPSCSGEDQMLFGFIVLPYISVVAFGAISALLTVPFRKGDS